jgi:hypothetical protein
VPRSYFASFLLPLLLVACLGSAAIAQATPESDNDRVVAEFLLLLLGSEDGRQEALDFVESHWQPSFTAMLLEVLTFSRDPAFTIRLIRVLEDKTGQSFGFAIDRWQQWLWNQDLSPHPAYPEFKSAFYGLIDQRFEDYFGPDRPYSIRLDEVVWGGVKQDGIPPLRHPDMVAAGEAAYLSDDDVVFGLEVNGDARAYPRRILGWHEMFVDDVGGVPVAGVYCTLCGTMILYKTRLNGVAYQLGTSGFLYRSNKLMYDKETQSLWNTIWGKPVIGPLAASDVALERMSVVTTRWGEWRRRHPDTQVLALGTGYQRDYAEGAAYSEYFATDQLMFQVPLLDSRLKNKDEVLGLVFPEYPGQPLAISVNYLAAHTLYQDQVGEKRFAVFTDASGAHRVYATGVTDFKQWDGMATVVDAKGMQWTLEEAHLQAEDGRIRHRLPAHRAFWFGWFSAYNHTRLVH